MSPFGTPAPAAAPQGDAGASTEQWQVKMITPVTGEEKTTQKGKVYWRVQDSNKIWYSIWEEAIAIRLDAAQQAGEAVKCAVKIDGNFKNINGTDDAAEAIAAEGKTRAVASVAPGGKNSQWNRRMHPDDALRVTNLACQERAIQMVALTIMDKPEGVNYETFVKAKLVEYTNFLSSLINQPLTPTPQDVPSLPGGEEDTYDDIPL